MEPLEPINEPSYESDDNSLVSATIAPPLVSAISIHSEEVADETASSNNSLSHGDHLNGENTR